MKPARASAFIGLLAAMLLAACGGGGDDANNGVICVGGCPSEGVVAVDNGDRAERLASAVAQVAIAAVPTGSYTGRVVNGLSGSASMSGHSSSSRESCGSSCTRLSHDTNVTAVFNGYRAKLGSNQEVTLTGTVSITDNTFNRTTATASTSGGSMVVESSNLSAQHAITDTGNGQVWGESDTVAVSTSSPAGSNWSGTLRGGNGVAYSF
jgi:hypothetical protein